MVTTAVRVARGTRRVSGATLNAPGLISGGVSSGNRSGANILLAGVGVVLLALAWNGRFIAVWDALAGKTGAGSETGAGTETGSGDKLNTRGNINIRNPDGSVTESYQPNENASVPSPVSPDFTDSGRYGEESPSCPPGFRLMERYSNQQQQTLYGCCAEQYLADYRAAGWRESTGPKRRGGEQGTRNDWTILPNGTMSLTRTV